MTENENFDYAALEPDALVALFADKHRRNPAIIALVGGLTATQLKQVRLSEAAFQALTAGLQHSNPKVRWWRLQLFDHIGDARCVPYILPLLNDPIPRVAKHARHALECEICKQSPDAAQKIQQTIAEKRFHAENFFAEK